MAKTKKTTTKITRNQSYENFLNKDFENEFASALNIFERLGNSIQTFMNILVKNGENNLNRTFSEKEAEDFLKRFSK